MAEICIQGLFSRSGTSVTTESRIHMFSRGFGGEGNFDERILDIFNFDERFYHR